MVQIRSDESGSNLSSWLPFLPFLWVVKSDRHVQGTKQKKTTEERKQKSTFATKFEFEWDGWIWNIFFRGNWLATKKQTRRKVKCSIAKRSEKWLHRNSRQQVPSRSRATCKTDVPVHLILILQWTLRLEITESTLTAIRGVNQAFHLSIHTRSRRKDAFHLVEMNLFFLFLSSL